MMPIRRVVNQHKRSNTSQGIFGFDIPERCKSKFSLVKPNESRLTQIQSLKESQSRASSKYHFKFSSLENEKNKLISTKDIISSDLYKKAERHFEMRKS
jgi:hypothetical protein